MKILIRYQNIITNIYSIQAYLLIVYRYSCIGFTDFLLKSKSLLDYSNKFSANDYEKNDNIIKKIFSWIDFKKVRMRKIYCTKCKKYKKIKKAKIYICGKALLYLIFVFNEEESIEILKLLGLIENI